MSDNHDERSFVEPEDLRDRLACGERATVVDVRSPEEFATGHVYGAIEIAAAKFADRIDELSDDEAVVTVCTLEGARPCGAANQLHTLGHRNVTPLRGGIRRWVDRDVNKSENDRNEDGLRNDPA